MILRRLRVRDFLGFADATFEFAPGINVIVGPNEAGKSTLRAAIRASLYGNPGTTSAKLDMYRSWATGQAPALELDFEADGRRYKVIKDFQARKVLLTGAGEALDQHKKVAERIAGFLGLATAEVFATTAEVAQAELERVQLTSVSRELGRMLGGGDDVITAIRRLEQRVREMEKGLKGLTKEPGLLRALDDRVTSLQAQHGRLVAQVAELDRKQRELTELAGPLAVERADLDAKRQLLEQNREMLRLEQQLQALAREEALLAEKVTRIEQTAQTLSELAAQLEELTAAGMPDEQIVRDARALAERSGLLQAQIAELAREDASPPRARVRIDTRITLASAVGLTLAVVGVVVAALGAQGWGGGLGSVGLLILAAVLAARHRHQQQIQRAAAMLQAHQHRVTSLQSQLHEERQALADKLAQVGSASVETAEARLQRYQDVVRAREHALKTLEASRAGESDEVLRNRLHSVRVEVYGLTKELAEPDQAARRLTPLQVQSLAGEVDRLGREVGQSTEWERRLQWEVEHGKTEVEELALVEEQLQEAQESLALARHRHAVYRVALDGLQDARQRVERPVREVVAGRSGEYLRILSSGRYDRLEVEKDSLTVWVWSNEAGGRVEPKEPFLSRGTVDLVYLSLRLALIGTLAEGKAPPLLLDDPFITFDDARRAAAARLLRELIGAHQVFLFTCTSQFEASADHVITLPVKAGTISEPAVSSTVADTPLARSEAGRPTVGPLWEHPPTR